MMKTLFIIPVMFTKEELARICSDLPDDYEEKTTEFWAYVSDKLKTQRAVHKIYYDSLTKEKMNGALEFIEKSNVQSYNIVKRFKEAGAELLPTEDSLLLEEAASWARMLNEESDASSVTQEFLGQTMTDRDRYITKTIDESLKEGETALLFLKPGRHASDYFSSEIRVIKIQPFDPSDYLNAWLVTLKLRSRNNSEK